jgi:hypothetical protein
LVLGAMLGIGPSVHAGVGDAVSGHRFTVLGALQTAYVSTVVQCTNLAATGSASGPFTVEFFDGNGVLVDADSMTLAPGTTGSITSSPVASQPAPVVLTVPNDTAGTMRILTDLKRIGCHAFLIAPTAGPGYIDGLTILPKGKQSGD